MIRLIRLDDAVDILEDGLELVKFSDSASDSEGNATGGRRCGLDIRLDARFCASLSVERSTTECPSSADIETLGGVWDESSVGNGGGGDDLEAIDMCEAIEFLGDDPTVSPEPCVLTLNLDVLCGGFHEMMLSRRLGRLAFDARNMLCRRVRSRTFFSVKGKYSAR